MSRARRLNAFCCGGCGLLVRFRGLVCLVCGGAVAAVVLLWCCAAVLLAVVVLWLWCVTGVLLASAGFSWIVYALVIQ